MLEVMTEAEAYDYWCHRNDSMVHFGSGTYGLKDRFAIWLPANSGRYSVPIKFDLDEANAMLRELIAFCNKANFPQPRDMLQWLQDSIFRRRYEEWITENNVIANLGLVELRTGGPLDDRHNTMFFPFHQHAVLFKLRWCG